MERIERIPVPLLATMAGALTLSNVYGGMGFVWVRHFFMWVTVCVMIAYIIKMIKFPQTCINEYKQVVPCSLYAGFSMCVMILGSYFYEMGWAFGKPMWALGICIHAVQILVFTYRNVIRERNIDTFIPSWFATYNGILVGCVVGGIMDEADKLKYIVFYGIAIYAILVPIMVWRLIRYDVKPGMYHAQAVILAPCSLCLAGAINITPWMPEPVFYILYVCVILSLIFVISLLPKAFAYDFYPGYAGITFPMAIGIVATNKFAGYLAEHGKETLSGPLTQIGGFQLYLTTMIIGYVLMKFFNMLIRQQPVSLS